MKLLCSHCESYLPASKFSVRSDTPRGYRSNCKTCERELCKAAYETRMKRKARFAKLIHLSKNPKVSPRLRKAARLAFTDFAPAKPDKLTSFLTKLQTKREN